MRRTNLRLVATNSLKKNERRQKKLCKRDPEIKPEPEVKPEPEGTQEPFTIRDTFGIGE